MVDPSGLTKSRSVVDRPIPGITAVIKVLPFEPIFGVRDTSFGSKVIPALMMSYPSGIPTGKKRLTSVETRSLTYVITNTNIVSLWDKDSWLTPLI